MIDPVAAQCVCEEPVEMEHFLLMGKKRYNRLVEDREWCLQALELGEIED